VSSYPSDVRVPMAYKHAAHSPSIDLARMFAYTH